MVTYFEPVKIGGIFYEKKIQRTVGITTVAVAVAVAGNNVNFANVFANEVTTNPSTKQDVVNIEKQEGNVLKLQVGPVSSVEAAEKALEETINRIKRIWCSLLEKEKIRNERS